MNRLMHAHPRDRPWPDGPGEFALPWWASAACAVLGTGALAFLPWRASWGTWGAALSIHLSVLACGLLALAAALYVAIDSTASRTVGRRAALLAMVGAWTLLGSSALRAADAAWPSPELPASYAVAYEAPSWLAAAAVLASLRIDQAWRTRRAGAVVLPLVVAALMLDMWLIGSSPQMPGQLAQVLQAQLGWGWHAGGKLGVAACVALTGWCFARARARSEPSETWLRSAMILGFAGFTVALVCAAAMMLVPGTSAAEVRRLIAGAAVWVNFGLPFMVWRSGRGRPGVLVWWLILGIGFAAVAYLVALGPQGAI